MSDEGAPSDTTVCAACATAVPSYDVVSYGSIERGYRALCTSCFNTEVASALGLKRFEHVRLQPIVMTDCAGEQHEFRFRTTLLGDVMALEAFEFEAGMPGGYQFEMLGEPDGEPLPLLGSLIERMRRSLSVRYLVRDEDGARIAGLGEDEHRRIERARERQRHDARHARNARHRAKVAHARARGVVVACDVDVHPRRDRTLQVVERLLSLLRPEDLEELDCVGAVNGSLGKAEDVGGEDERARAPRTRPVRPGILSD